MKNFVETFQPILAKLFSENEKMVSTFEFQKFRNLEIRTFVHDSIHFWKLILQIYVVMPEAC